MDAKWIIGIDEAGRGPLAGPVVVGAVLVPSDFDFGLVKGVRDSKKLTAKARNDWYGKILALEERAGMRHVVSESSASIIDSHGIVEAIARAIARCLERLGADPDECDVRLDGAIHAPKRFVQQKTIIRGDDTEPIISLASVAAKVHRDRLMEKLAVVHPAYGFERHKGYGTRFHYTAIESSGIIPLIHRTTFLRK